MTWKDSIADEIAAEFGEFNESVGELTTDRLFRLQSIRSQRKSRDREFLPVQPKVRPNSIRQRALAAGIAEGTVRSRMRAGCPADVALTKGVSIGSLAILARSVGLKERTLRARLSRGWTLEKAISEPAKPYTDMRSRVLSAGLSYNTYKCRRKVYSETEEQAFTELVKRKRRVVSG